MFAKRGFGGFEVQGFGVGVIAYRNDFEVNVGPYGLTMLPDGLFIRGWSGERHWHWDEVKAWFTRKPLDPVDAV